MTGDAGAEIVGDDHDDLFGGASDGSAGLPAFDAVAGPGSGDPGLISNISWQVTCMLARAESMRTLDAGRSVIATASVV